MGGLTRALGRSYLWAISGALLLTAACGGSEPEPNSQFQAGGQYPPPQQTQPYPAQPGQPYPAQPGQPYPAQPGQPYPGTAPAPAPSASSPIPGLPGIPGLPLPPNAPAGSPAQQLDASAGAAAQPLINQLATTQAPGAKPVGAAVVGMFQPGQQLETPLQLQPGKCYTVIAVGLPPVTEVNIQLVASVAVPGMNPVLAQDQTTGSQTALGPAPNCYKWPFPLAGAAKLITSVPAGQGLAAVQVYEK